VKKHWTFKHLRKSRVACWLRVFLPLTCCISHSHLFFGTFIFWNLRYSVMDKLNQLLSIPGFLAAIGELLMHDDPHIRRKALDLFNQKVTQEASVLSPEEIVLFLDFTTQLQKLLEDEFAACKAADAAEREAAAGARRSPQAAATVTVANMQVRSVTFRQHTWLACCFTTCRCCL